MNYLSVDNLSKSFGDTVLFEQLCFGLQKGDKAALVASNGAGKTTLMRILSGKQDLDSGSFSFADGIHIGFLEQQPEFDGHLTINELITGSHTFVMQVIREYETALEHQNSDYSAEHQKTLEQATSRMDQYHAWDYERRLKQLLNRFGILHLNQTIDTLSGGQKKRLAMALVLHTRSETALDCAPTEKPPSSTACDWKWHWRSSVCIPGPILERLDCASSTPPAVAPTFTFLNNGAMSPRCMTKPSWPTPAKPGLRWPLTWIPTDCLSADYWAPGLEPRKYWTSAKHEPV